MSLRRMQVVDAAGGVLGAYLHGAAAPDLGRIGVLVAIETDADAGKMETIAKQVAMHVAAASPQSISREDLDPAAVERERTRSDRSGEGLGQAGEHHREDGRRPSSQVLRGSLPRRSNLRPSTARARSAMPWPRPREDAGGKAKVAAVARFALGEGLAKREEDFAAEVAKATGA